MDLKGRILHIVKGNNGIKLNVLCSDLTAKEWLESWSREEIIDKVNDLVSNHELIEIEYSIDMLNVSSFLLPKETQYNVRGKKEKIHRI